MCFIRGLPAPGPRGHLCKETWTNWPVFLWTSAWERRRGGCSDESDERQCVRSAHRLTSGPIERQLINTTDEMKWVLYPQPHLSMTSLTAFVFSRVSRRDPRVWKRSWNVLNIYCFIVYLNKSNGWTKPNILKFRSYLLFQLLYFNKLIIYLSLIY